MSRKRSKRRKRQHDARQVDLLSEMDEGPATADPVAVGSDVDESVGGAPPTLSRAGSPGPEEGGREEPDRSRDETLLEPAPKQTDTGRREASPGMAAHGPREPGARPGEISSTEPTRVAPANTEAPAPQTSVRSPGEALVRAKEMVERGRVTDAIALYRDILQTNPNSLKARNNLGALLDELGQHDLALTHFEAAEQIDPDSVEVLTNLGSSLGALSRYEAAEQKLFAALRLAPEDIGVRAAFGVLSFRRGTYAHAVQELTWVCEKDPDNGNFQYYLGESLNRLGRYDEAIVPLERATELRPGDPRAFFTLGHLYDRMRLPDEASEMFRRARELQGR